jgi:hypothetical protein
MEVSSVNLTGKLFHEGFTEIKGKASKIIVIADRVPSQCGTSNFKMSSKLKPNTTVVFIPNRRVKNGTRAMWHVYDENEKLIDTGIYPVETDPAPDGIQFFKVSPGNWMKF